MERDKRDFYIEEAWTSRRLFEVEKFVGPITDPAVGTGTITLAATTAGYKSRGYDIANRSGADAVRDFLTHPTPAIDIVSNPPFDLCQAARGGKTSIDFAFVKVALTVARHKVALLLPTDYVHGAKRQKWLATTPLYRVYFLSPRPKLFYGAGEKKGQQVRQEEDMAWYVWLRGFEGHWIGHFLNRDEGARPHERTPSRRPAAKH